MKYQKSGEITVVILKMKSDKNLNSFFQEISKVRRL